MPAGSASDESTWAWFSNLRLIWGVGPQLDRRLAQDSKEREPVQGSITATGAPGEPAACHHAAMFRPDTTKPRTPCWHCRHMISVEAVSSVVRCGVGEHPRCMVLGREGCAQWEREPGIDDDDWNPVPPPFTHPPPQRARNVSRDGWWTEPPRQRRAESPALPVYALPARDPFGGLFNWQDDG